MEIKEKINGLYGTQKVVFDALVELAKQGILDASQGYDWLAYNQQNPPSFEAIISEIPRKHSLNEVLESLNVLTVKGLLNERGCIRWFLSSEVLDAVLHPDPQEMETSVFEQIFEESLI